MSGAQKFRYVVVRSEGCMAEKAPVGAVLFDRKKHESDGWAGWTIFDHETRAISGDASAFYVGKLRDGDIPTNPTVLRRWAAEEDLAADKLDDDEAASILRVTADGHRQRADADLEAVQS